MNFKELALKIPPLLESLLDSKGPSESLDGELSEFFGNTSNFTSSLDTLAQVAEKHTSTWTINIDLRRADGEMIYAAAHSADERDLMVITLGNTAPLALCRSLLTIIMTDATPPMTPTMVNTKRPKLLN